MLYWVKMCEVIDNLYLPEEKMLTLGSVRGWPSTAFAAGQLSGGTHMLTVLSGDFRNRSILDPRKCFRQMQHHFHRILFPWFLSHLVSAAFADGGTS